MDGPIGVVLAGGSGRRFGLPKGEALLGERTLASRAADTLARVCDGVWISVRPGGDNPAPGYPAIEDRPPGGEGPLAGVHAAYTATATGDLLVLACDYPWVDAELLRRLVALAPPDDDLVFPVDPTGRDHPLVGLWRRGLEDRVHEALRQRRLAVRDLIAASRVRRVLPAELGAIDAGRALTNVNRPADLSGPPDKR